MRGADGVVAGIKYTAAVLRELETPFAEVTACTLTSYATPFVSEENDCVVVSTVLIEKSAVPGKLASALLFK
jgi:hypothetical protein